MSAVQEAAAGIPADVLEQKKERDKDEIWDYI